MKGLPNTPVSGLTEDIVDVVGCPRNLEDFVEHRHKKCLDYGFSHAVGGPIGIA